MTNTQGREMNWTPMTVIVAALVSVLGLLVAFELNKLGVWPSWDYSEVIFGGLCGATVVHRMHPGRPIAVLLVVVPVMSVLLLIGTVLFYIYVLGQPLDF